MPVECIERPELKGPVLDLIKRVADAHKAGEFTIELAELFLAFGLTLEEVEVEKLRARGAVSFTPSDKKQGEFYNEGAEQKLATGEGVTIVVPETLSGTYETTRKSLTLMFDEGSALRGCKRFFVLVCQDIIKIEADEHQLYIDLPGDMYDMCFVF
ncbi:MAG TPA: hypothetical protein VF528_10675 [Pyrinomonadaceae bacterium]|jgi:hypothetical protein